ncbi:MAG: helix-turn-helix domain-containing protein [Myxococcota bacterium]
MTARRITILRAAERLLVHYGPSKTTVADIAREARIGVGSVYLEFTSKEAIVEALSEAQHAAVLEAERRAWAEGGGARARLRRVFDARFEAFAAIAAGPAHARDLLYCDARSVKRVQGRFGRAEEDQLHAMLQEPGVAEELGLADPRAAARALRRAYAAFAPPHLFDEPLDRLRRDLPLVHQLVLGLG